MFNSGAFKSLKSKFIVLALVAASATGLALCGCSALGVKVTGGGSFSIGMENSNYITLKQGVDGDKEGKEAKVEVEITK